MKREVGQIDAIPSKRLFLSIIADYDLNRSICEMIDNALDIWVRGGKRDPLNIQIDLNKDQQTICVFDNAGGVKKENLRFIVGPGQTTNLPEDEVIGIFGVGTKRAVVALAQDIKITTRHNKEKTCLVEFDQNWIGEEDWSLPMYEVDEITEGTTIIELQRLRFRITDEAIDHLKDHIRATYARFLLNSQLTINIGGDKLDPLYFEDWAYPPNFEPHRYVGEILTEDVGTVRVEVVAGLCKQSSPAMGEYGVYFYCNDRLIARGLKSYDVGYAKGLAGLPHPSISLVRIIVSLTGQAQSMPWNSSKSGMNPKHPVFVALRNWLIQVVKDYSSLSRRLVSDWPDKIFKHTSGNIVQIEIDSFPTANKSYLPPLPKSKPRYGDLVKKANRKIAKNKPWTTGLYEAIIAVDMIFKQRLEEKNRICLILLDSMLEIAFKEYLVNESGHIYGDHALLSLFTNRTSVQEEIKEYVNIDTRTWSKVDFYYRLRCKLVHERATVPISDNQIEDYRGIVQKILRRLFRLRFTI